MTVDHAQLRYVLTTTAPLALLVVATTVWAVMASSDVPDPMASHFGVDGTADGFSAPVTNIIIFTAMSTAILVLLSCLGLTGLSNGPAARTNAAAMGFTVTLVCLLEYRIFEIQRGLTDAASAELDLVGELWTFGLATVVGGALALVTRPVPDTLPPLRGTLPPADRPDGVRVAWFGSSTMTIWVQLAVYGITVVFLVTDIAGGGGVLSRLGYFSFLALIILACSTWRYRVDAEGFTYRSALGIPRAKVPYDQILAAELITVHPGEWGGWGYRFNGTGTGLVTGSGSGIRIYRTSRKNIELNCADAANGIAALRYHGVSIYTPEAAEV